MGAFGIGSALTTLLWQPMVNDAQDTARRAIATTHEALGTAETWKDTAANWCRAYTVASGNAVDCPPTDATEAAPPRPPQEPTHVE